MALGVGEPVRVRVAERVGAADGVEVTSFVGVPVMADWSGLGVTVGIPLCSTAVTAARRSGRSEGSVICSRRISRRMSSRITGTGMKLGSAL